MAMPSPTTNDGGPPGVLNLERELVCFICTEILFQPLTLIDCLHTFCGSCLREWFSHQYRKATSSHHHSSSSTTSPYTCATCRAHVKDVKPNAMVNTWLDIYLKANPSRDRSAEDKKEQMEMYKPGDNIMPKVSSGRRRERRGRRDEDEARERRMIEAATEESLRELQIGSHHTHDHLLAPAPPRSETASRSRDTSRDREREERRQRRREREEERRIRRQENDNGPSESHANSQRHRRTQSASPPSSPPSNSLRHPEAVEARSRQQTVVHQASLVSLISSSESGTGTGSSDHLDSARIMQEIVDSGFLNGIDVDSLTEAEQDMWAERIAEEYRRRMRANSQQNHSAQQSAPSTQSTSNTETSLQPDAASHQHRHRRSASATSGQHQTEATAAPQRDDLADRPRFSRTQPANNAGALAPPATIVTHRRRQHSSHSQSRVGSRTRSRQSSPTGQIAQPETRSAIELAHDNRAIEQPSFAQRVGRSPPISRTSTEPHSPPQAPIGSLPAMVERQHVPLTDSQPPIPPPVSASASSVSPPSTTVAELPGSGPKSPRGASRSLSISSWQAPPRFDEPSVSCFRCLRADIQYEVYKHCDRCELDLCLRCYRKGRGCKHWYGFGFAAMAKFESLIAEGRISEQIELPHMLVGRSLRKPHESLIIESKRAKDGHTIIPRKTMSDPATRTQQGHFCDRCGAYADNCFWSCDVCNDGEWGFCRECVNSHHCCTHPLLPIAHKSTAPANATLQPATESSSTQAPSELHATNLAPSLRPSQPSSATSAVSGMVGPLPEYLNLNITTHCDICHQAINATYLRYHCPFHPSPTPENPHGIGDYDICTQCYHNLVKNNRVRRDDGPAGWRKCSSGHRMIITTFEKDEEGAMRRVIVKNLVGGRKMTDADVSLWSQNMNRYRDQMQLGSHNDVSPTSSTINNAVSSTENNPTWQWRDNKTTANRRKGTRKLSLFGSSSASTSTSASAQSNPQHSSTNSTMISTGAATTTPTSSTSHQQQISHANFPPDAGFGSKALAIWPWYPAEGDEGKDELMFPRGAEIQEIMDVNGEWWEGVYAGDIGFAPNGYVRINN